MSKFLIEADSVLDSSAFLAYLHDETGGDIVESYLGVHAAISIVNWAEVLAKLADLGSDPTKSIGRMEGEGVLNNLAIHPMSMADSIRTAELRPLTKQFGLSLGDRACIALAERLGKPAVTADRAWAGLSIGIEIHVIR